MINLPALVVKAEAAAVIGAMPKVPKTAVSLTSSVRVADSSLSIVSPKIPLSLAAAPKFIL